MNNKNIPQLELQVDSMSHGAFAIAHENGESIFVENSCPGDKALVSIYDKRKNFSYAQIENLIEASEYRAKDPKCKLHKICGGCQWQHINYEQQLKFKRSNIIDLLKKAQINLSELKIPEVLGMEDPWNYRNKIVYPVRTVESSSRTLAGYFKRNSNELVNIKYCPIQYSIFDEIMSQCKELCTEHKIKHPLIRHIQIRSNFAKSEILVTFIVREKLMSNELKTSFSKIAEALLESFPAIKGCSLNYNDMSTNVILGKNTETLLGEKQITETLGDIKLKISATSFFQVNNLQFLKIIDTINKFIDCDLDENDHILDAYSGTGTIALSIAKASKNLKITAIEVVESAVEDAKANAGLNDIKNIDFKLGKVEDHIEDLVNSNLKLSIINPPRKGCTNKVLDTLAKISTEKIIYVSCNPATLARDIKYLENYGYKLEKIQAVDMFPHTFHVENVVLLKKSKL